MGGVKVMSEMFHNMSVPPTSLVYFKMEQLNDYYCFNPITLSKLLNCKYENLSTVVKEYCDKHRNIISNIKKPTGYMLGETKLVTDLGKVNFLKNYKYEECNDLELLILVFCGTVGDLYIPNRALSFENYKFERVLLFAKAEVDS